MSSESWAGSRSEGQGEDPQPEEKQDEEAEKEEAGAPSQDKRRTECPRREAALSLDHRGMQEVTSQGGVEKVQRAETPTLTARVRFSNTTVNQESPARQSDKYSVQHPDDPRGPGPFYFFRGSNGAEIVSSYCESRGWKRIYNKNREDFKLKWCETKSSVNYCNFREGEQLLYQIPNNKVLTTKIGLLSSLREYERVCSKVNHGRGLRRLKMEEFIPTTFRMDVREEREAFFGQQEGVRSNSESCMWICKPTGLNQGRGIFLLKSQDDIDAFRLKLQHMEESQANKMHHCQPQARIVQHYIQNPLLLKGKKFDVRSYLLIACTAPYMVFFRHGYVRLTCDLYDPSSSKLSDHLTNQHMQKKNPLYSQLKEDTVWSMESFNAYVNHRFQVAKGLPRDWVLGAFAKHMQRIMTQCFFAVKSKLDRRLGLFDLIGCDFMVDEDFKVWLLEMNCNPALHTNCEVLKEVIPSTVAETLDVTLEIFNKCRLRQGLLPLTSQGEFVLLYSGADSAPACNRSDTNTEFPHKTTKKTQKTEGRRCKSGMEGNNVSAASPDNCATVSESGEGRGRSKSGRRPASAADASPLFQSSSSVQRSSNPHSSSTQAARGKKLQPRVQFKLSKCTVHAGAKTHSETRQKTQAVTLLPPASESSEGLSVRGSPETAALFPPQARHPASVDQCERGEEPAEKQLREDTKSLVCERKEEL
ncbi:protein polyglycylase TTLL10 [Scophthalmus maximus]|uniref:protein polyglycylase TTLL10 n=1 Tax=Scophthalmus maximus TaxID=52904 RepID=UPI001FA89F11|nr:protein polyglycylase TTLL10 [Scophthalmus maximus]XP_035501983.2 protein polyglycylase TTLL10 [Scophthalmus maximus]XP_035501985.2 protein polyglycylase TTLL10 [Scophthalmus maximus]XP_047186672.1 protein polyglycylase TTLL10 [Scophthalmus maximus]